MSDQWGTREHPSDRDPGRLRTEHVFLIIAAVSLSAALATYILDATLPIELNRGAYSIMVAFFVAGYGGWLTHSSERRMRRVAVGELRRLAAAVDELREQVRKQQRVTYLPASPRTSEGHRYIGAVAGGAEDAADTNCGIDPDSIDALRRIRHRLRSVDNE